MRVSLYFHHRSLVTFLCLLTICICSQARTHMQRVTDNVEGKTEIKKKKIYIFNYSLLGSVYSENVVSRWDCKSNTRCDAQHDKLVFTNISCKCESHLCHNLELISLTIYLVVVSLFRSFRKETGEQLNYGWS